MFMLQDLLLVTDCHILGLEGKQKKLLKRQKGLRGAFTDGDFVLDYQQTNWHLLHFFHIRTNSFTLLSAVYVDNVDENRVVTIRPESAFRPLFEIAVTRRDSGIILISEKAKEGRNRHLPLARQAGADVDLFLVETGEGRTPRPEDTPTRIYYRFI